MGSMWFYNLVGFQLKERELKTIPHPELELNFHVTLKCVQVFSTLGTLVIGPLVGVAKKSTRSFQGIVQSSTKFGRYGIIAAAFIGPAMTYGRMKSIKADHSAFYDRCYRLRHNKNQLRVDRAHISGMVLGTVLFPTVLKMCPIFGGLFGMSVGVISMGIYNNMGS